MHLLRQVAHRPHLGRRQPGRPKVAVRGRQYGLNGNAAEGRFEQEGWRLRKDGSRFWAHVVIDPIHAPTGELLGYAKAGCLLGILQSKARRALNSKARKNGP